MKYIRDYYNVPVKRGGRVAFTRESGDVVLGRITSARGQYIMVRLDNKKKPLPFHPTYNIEYL